MVYSKQKCSEKFLTRAECLYVSDSLVLPSPQTFVDDFIETNMTGQCFGKELDCAMSEIKFMGKSFFEGY